MSDFLDKLRNKSEHERRRIAFMSASVVVFILFLMWATATTSQLHEEEVSVQETQKASVGESLSRKIELLFGADTQVQESEEKAGKGGFFESEPIEYKKEASVVESEEMEEDPDLQALLEAFNATTSATTTEEENALNDVDI